MPPRVGELVISSAFIVVGAGFFGLSFGIPDPDASLYPRILLTGLLIFSGWYFIDALRGRPGLDQAPGEEGIDPAHFVGVLGLSLLYIPAMVYAGYLTATAVFIAVGIYLAGYRRVGVLLVVSLLVTMFVFVVFKTLMYASLPSSALDTWVTEALYRYFPI